MEGNISVESVTPGFRYSVGIGSESFYDNDGNRALTPPTEMRGGWAATEEEAHRLAQEALESMGE